MVPAISALVQIGYAMVAAKNQLVAVARALREVVRSLVAMGPVVVAVIPAKTAIVSRAVAVVVRKRTLVHPMRAVAHALIPSMLRTSVVRCVHASHENADGSCHLRAGASHPLACSTRLCAVGDEINQCHH